MASGEKKKRRKRKKKSEPKQTPSVSCLPGFSSTIWPRIVDDGEEIGWAKMEQSAMIDFLLPSRGKSNQQQLKFCPPLKLFHCRFILLAFLLAFTTLLSLHEFQPTCTCLEISSSRANKWLAPTSSILDSLLGNSGDSAQKQPNQEEQTNKQTSYQLQQQQAQQAAVDLHNSYRSAQTSDKVTLPGDILLGGLFPIHQKGAKIECGEINRDRGIQRLEAMLYALDRINEDSKLLPDIQLGAILLDSCSSSTYALNQSLEFIRASINTVESSAFECKDKSTPRPKYGSKMIAGVIGGSYSEVSLQVANLLRLFRIPQVSYASTGTALSDKTLYDLFARTVPSDMFQARAIADIVLKLNWSYVSLVSSEGLYGDSGSKEFSKQASVRRICIATHEKLSPTADEPTYDSIVASLLKRNATGVVLFTRAEDTRELLLAVKRAKLFHNFAWVAADGWGTQGKLVEGVEEVARGAITVELQAKAIPGFDQYMKALTPWANGRNPWFSEYWQEWFDCQLQANLLQQQQVASGTFNLRRGVPLDPSQSQFNSYSGSGSGSSETPLDYTDSMGDESLTSDETLPASRKRRRSLVSSNTTSSKQELKLVASERRLKNESNLQDFKDKTNRKLEEGRRRKRSASVANSAPNLKQFCSPNLRISESNGYRQEQKVQFVVDAVYAMAHALHKAWFNLCDAQPGVVCEALKELNGGEFYAKYLLNVSFKDLAGSEVKFDERGDGLGRYNIYNFRQVKSGPQVPSSIGGEFSSNGNSFQANLSSMNSNNLLDQQQTGTESSFNVETGNGENSNLANTGDSGGGAQQVDELSQLEKQETSTLTSSSSSSDGAATTAAAAAGSPVQLVEHIFTSNADFEYSSIGRWTESDYYLQLEDIQFIQGDSLIPESYCSRPCELGQAKIMRAGDHCCWICKTCAPFEFLPDEFSCRDCGVGRWPIANKTSCFDLPQKYLRWDSIYSLISLTIACLGIGLTIFVTVIFVKYIDTPVVKASGRELSFILLAGIAFCHLSTFVLLAKPTTFICGSQRFLVNFGFSLMYASLLVKTNRISRIFNCARKSAKRPSFISPKSQMLITGILVAIQIFLTIVWFIFESPGIRADSPEGKRDEVILKCRAKGKSFIISLVYNMILITTCTIYAVKTRKIPENFNESKFIGFTMYTTIVIWLAFVTMFFGTNNSYEIQINTMCVCISLSAYVTLFCLFSPKLSIILLHPDKNVRKLTMNSATYKRPFKPVSSLASVDGRINTTGLVSYNGQQTEAGSGGLMSTTSNVLNPDCQASTRLQESSIVSNVVNSNSASNCSQSQKAPTPQPQQLALVGTCANCGAHQLAQVSTCSSQTRVNCGTTIDSSAPIASSNLNQQEQTKQVRHYKEQHLAGGSNNEQRVVRLTTSGRAGTESNKQQPMANRSSVLVNSHFSCSNPGFSSTQAAPCTAAAHHMVAAGTGSRSPKAAKVVHSRIYTTGRHTERTATACDLRAGIGKRPPKRMASDEQLVAEQRRRQQGFLGSESGNRGGSSADHSQGNRKSLVTTSGNNNNNKHMASLSKLTELTSTTSSNERHCLLDESISGSMANDSLANTSQEHTPCNEPGNHHHDSARSAARASAGCVMIGSELGEYHEGNEICATGNKGSDSMLWNQSVYSIDYCSDCCPSSYCHCSCLACSSSNGEEVTMEQVACLHATNSSLDHNNHHQHLDEREFEMQTCDSILSQDQEHNLMLDYCDQPMSSEQLQQAHSSTMRADYLFDGSGNGSGSGRNSRKKEQQIASGDGGDSMQTTRRSQTMEMRNLANAEYGTANSKPKDGRIEQATDNTSASGSMLIAQANRLVPANQCLAGQTTVTSATKPVVYAALQAAANSALGACTQVAASIQPPAKASTDVQQQQQYIQFTSSKNKFNSETRTPRRSQEEPEGRVNQQQLVVGVEQAGGTIQASLELIKSASQRRKDMDGSSRRRHGSSCFSYHDDYEYNYGLVQSNSDSECYYDEDSGGSGETRLKVFQRATGSNEEDYDHREEDDDFEHDGRVSLNRDQRAELQIDPDRNRKRSSSSRRSRSRSSVGNQELSNSDHRINSVALIAATLSAGGAIVETGNSQPVQQQPQQQQAAGGAQVQQVVNQRHRNTTGGGSLREMERDR